MAWNNTGNIRGPQGPAGQNGATGTRGSQWTTGTGAPSSLSGTLAGDLYLDRSTSTVYRVVSGAWVSQGPLADFVPSRVVISTPATPLPNTLYFETG